MMTHADTVAAFTTTIPVEVLLAAGMRPTDLNNRFITDKDAEKRIEDAEIRGFPRSSCAWIKGMYATLAHNERYRDIDLFIAVSEGDCSNARVLAEVIAVEFGIDTFEFRYPRERSVKAMKNELDRFCSRCGVTPARAEEQRTALRPLRNILREIDTLAHRFPGSISNETYHTVMVSASDFNGDPDEYRSGAQTILDDTAAAVQNDNYCNDGMPVVAYCGVPPVYPVHRFFDTHGVPVVFNEIQNEFAMLSDYNDLSRQYTEYTYPYSAAYRFSRMIEHLRERRPVQGIIHYVQSFCHRQIEDILLRRLLAKSGMTMSILTLEGDKPEGGAIHGQIRTRLEAFIEAITLKQH